MRFLVVMILFFEGSASFAAPQGMVKILGGSFEPFYNRDKDGNPSKASVTSFYIDRFPVTNHDFLQFVKKYKKWQKGTVKSLFADAHYLEHWPSNLKIEKSQENEPVRFVSWFAALAYCESLGKTLPTVLQWEYVASADEVDKLAIKKDSYKRRILEWYSKPNPKKYPDVGSGIKNVWGVSDLHGLIWEWNLDYNTALVTGESREDSILDKNRFCGSGSLNAKDKLDYGAFMRFGYRSALKGSNTASNLGFRCSKSISGGA